MNEAGSRRPLVLDPRPGSRAGVLFSMAKLGVSEMRWTMRVIPISPLC
jgi:hypothetical protein